MRTARVERKTKESHVLVEINLDGQGIIDVDTGVPFFDHMMSQLGKHSGFDLTVKTTGDVDVDSHHTVEDTSLAFGQALREALGDKAGIRRFGDSMVPLDDVLVQAAVDLSGRPYLVHRQPEIVELIGTFDTTLGKHIWNQSLQKLVLRCISAYLKVATHTMFLKHSSRRSLAHCVMRFHLMAELPESHQQKVLFDSNS
jgi:imidazoleglycerol-phosphate dehydratase